jgi:hypothetical protein
MLWINLSYGTACKRGFLLRDFSVNRNHFGVYSHFGETDAVFYHRDSFHDQNVWEIIGEIPVLPGKERRYPAVLRWVSDLAGATPPAGPCLDVQG